MKYRETKNDSLENKKLYVDGFNSLIQKLQNDAKVLRNKYSENIFTDQERYRLDFKKMLGWPLIEHVDNEPPTIYSQKLSDEAEYEIFRVKFNILDTLTISGLLFKLKNLKKPLIIVQHGGEGTPEHISGVYGNTTNYNDMLHRILSKGVHVFAPQLLLWHDNYGVPYDRNEIDVRLKRVGSSISAVEIYAITRILDYFEQQNYVSSFGMIGLSYGGYYTLCASAIDTRIKSAYSCSFFNTRDNIAWSDFTFKNSAKYFDDAEIACLTYPRKLYISVGNKDSLFNFKNALNSFEHIKQLSRNVDLDWIQFKIFDGKHEFDKDDTFIDNLISNL